MREKPCIELSLIKNLFYYLFNKTMYSSRVYAYSQISINVLEPKNCQTLNITNEIQLTSPFFKIFDNVMECCENFHYTIH
jgi:hypothetical protein